MFLHCLLNEKKIYFNNVTFNIVILILEISRSFDCQIDTSYRINKFFFLYSALINPKVL